MAITGRGVLRIAIEDFLSTSKLGIWFSGWWTQFGEWFEDGVAGFYKDIFGNLANDTRMPASLRNLARGSGEGTHQHGIGQALGFAVGIGQQASGSFLAPFTKLLEYAGNNKTLPARFDPQVVIPLLWRDPKAGFTALDDLKDLGWSRERIDAYTKLMVPRPSEQMLISGWLRGKVTDGTLNSELFARGWEANSVALIKELSQIIPQVQDLIQMAVREAFTPAIIAKFRYAEGFPSEILEHTRKIGLSDEWVKRYWYAHWQLPSPQQGYEMLHRLRPGKVSQPFTKDDMDLLLRTADYAPYFRDKMIAISYSPFTRVDVRRMYKTGDLTYQGVIDSYMDIGYDTDKAKKLADFTVHYETGNESNLIDEYSELSREVVSSAYARGLISEGEFRKALTGMDIVGKAQDLVVAITELKRQVEKSPDYTKEYRSELKTMIEKAYAARIVDKTAAMNSMSAIGVPEAQASMLLANADLNYTYNVRSDTIGIVGKAFVAHAIDRGEAIVQLGKVNISGAEQQQILAEWDRERELRSRRLTQSQYEKAYLNSLITLDEYKDTLQGLGYTNLDIDILISFASAEVESGL